jgi:hypothetical protein
VEAVDKEKNWESGGLTGPYYFFMKVGTANMYLAQAKKEGLMWVGFDGDKIPQVAKNPLDDNWPQGVDRALTDLYYLAGATSQFVRESCRVVTFNSTHLQIWKITGALQDMTEIAAQRLDIEFAAGQKHFPAEIIREVPRSGLLGSINSLSVYQYLNRGTFRPVFRCYPGAFTDQSKNRWLLESEKLNGFWRQEETNYGVWVRLYLNSLAGESKWTVLPPLNAEQIRDLIPFIVSPAQLETAAMHFAQDLGLTVDIGSGKGLDKVDVRASVRHKEKSERDRIVRSALDLCSRNGFLLGDRVASNLLREFSLSIQCKNYDATLDSTGTEILLFSAHGALGVPGVVTLQQMMERQRPEFARLNDWVALVGSQIPRTGDQDT